MELFNRRYEILEKLGEGGLASVHLALDRPAGRCVALKFLHPEVSLDQLERRYFEREFRILAKLDLPGVPRAFDRGNIGDIVYISMQFIDGKPIHEFVDDEGLDWSESAGLLARAALRLDRLHRKGIVHRDVKASNILIDETRRPWWIDFGISSETYSHPFQEECDFVVGTLAYLAPERFQSPMALPDPRSDIYSLGVVLYRLLVGAVPFEGETQSDYSFRIGTKDPTPPHLLDPDRIPEAISQVVMKAMARDLDDRYRSAWEFASAVGEVLLPIASKRLDAGVVVAA